MTHGSGYLDPCRSAPLLARELFQYRNFTTTRPDHEDKAGPYEVELHTLNTATDTVASDRRTIFSSFTTISPRPIAAP